MSSARRTATTFLVVAASILGACTGDDDEPGEVTVIETTTTSTTVPSRSGDGVLSIGLLLPTTGAGAALGGPMIEAARLAVEQINAAGGVLGEPVILSEADEGESVSSAGIGLDTLISEGVDAIVGPASSLAALAELNTAVTAGVLTCSPTATALALDNFPDNGLFFRTAPSDSLQAAAIARAAELTGANTVAIGYLDDAYGRGMADAVEASLLERNLQMLERRGFARGTSDLSDLARDLLTDAPGVVVVLGDADSAVRLIAALGEQPANSPTPRIFVNDAVRMARSSQILIDLPESTRTSITGIAPLAITPDRDDLPGPYAAQAYDCVNLIALAAERAGTDAPARIATQMAVVSVVGSVCRSFESCLGRLQEDLQIAYTGPSGSLELSTRTGDPTRARFEQFTFDEDGRDQAGPWFEISA